MPRFALRRFALHRSAGLILPLLLLAGLVLAAAPDPATAAARALGGLPRTAGLVALVMTLGYGAGVPLGLAAAMPAGGPVLSRLLGGMGRGLAAVSGAVPGFLAVAVGVLLAGGPDAAPWMPAAALLLVLAPLAESARLARNALAAQADAGFLLAVRSRGLDGRAALIRHGRPLALGAVLATVGPVGTAVLCGAVAAEALFALPGCGAVLVGALHGGDGGTAVAAFAALSALALALHVGGSVAAARFDPRRLVP